MPNEHTQLRATGLRLWEEWTWMWNGQPERALALVAPRFVLHLPTPSIVDQTTVETPASVARWVTAHCARFQRLVFHTGQGPFVDPVACVVAGPWYADAVVDGSPRLVAGMDTIAFRDGKITEYWTLSKEVDAADRWVTALGDSRSTLHG